MRRAMIMAMKSDGGIDAAEQAFVQAEFRAPLDAGAIDLEVPRGLGQQVYAMSVMGVYLDNQREAQYLHDLASAIGIAPRGINKIHDHFGLPRIYA